MTVVFETERLVLRRWTLDEADVERVFDTYSQWEVARWLGAQPRALTSRDEAVKAIERWATRSTADGRGGVWAAQVRSTGVVAGSILLVALPEPADGPGTEELSGLIFDAAAETEAPLASQTVELGVANQNGVTAPVTFDVLSVRRTSDATLVRFQMSTSEAELDMSSTALGDGSNTEFFFRTALEDPAAGTRYLPLSYRWDAFDVTEIADRPVLYAPLTFTVGVARDVEFPAAQYSGNILANATGGVEHSAHDVESVAVAGETAKLVVATSDPSRKLEVVLGPLWVWLAYEERPSLATFLGGLVVVSAVVVQATGDVLVSRRIPGEAHV